MEALELLYTILIICTIFTLLLGTYTKSKDKYKEYKTIEHYMYSAIVLFTTAFVGFIIYAMFSIFG